MTGTMARLLKYIAISFLAISFQKSRHSANHYCYSVVMAGTMHAVYGASFNSKVFFVLCTFYTFLTKQCFGLVLSKQINEACESLRRSQRIL